MSHRAPELMRVHMPDASGRGAAVEQLPRFTASEGPAASTTVLPMLMAGVSGRVVRR